MASTFPRIVPAHAEYSFLSISTDIIKHFGNTLEIIFGSLGDTARPCPGGSTYNHRFDILSRAVLVPGCFRKHASAMLQNVILRLASVIVFFDKDPSCFAGNIQATGEFLETYISQTPQVSSHSLTLWAILAPVSMI